ncbi:MULTISPECIES: oxidative stress defense protein [unclassified Providencia]|uniref:oxidative stress defense protein n=1 Tax=unclassified Providencia TaxID=2633465 RepID=UPI000E936CAF|nr:oxidative stress defense protein [Providencia sp.]MBP6081580.1 oxidative stress defense protein [Providencia sp.]HBO21568.1 oxidative stress defense protein [Providencia sp.]
MKLKSLVLAAMMAGIAVPTLSLADALPSGAHITTSGNAIIKASPDMATLNINVEVTEKDAAAAKAGVDKRVAEYFEFLKKNGIEKKDINAANVRTQPKYEYNNETQKSTIVGYTAVRSVEVKVNKLDQLNTLLDGALASGLNEISSVQFGVINPQQYRDEARTKAMQNAIEQANALAKGFNVQLGPVYSINYNAPNAVPFPISPRNLSAKMNAAGAQDLNVNETYEQESIDFNDQVDVVFELKR